MLDVVLCAAFAFGLYTLVTNVPFKEGLIILVGVFCGLRIVDRKRLDTTG